MTFNIENHKIEQKLRDQENLLYAMWDAVDYGIVILEVLNQGEDFRFIKLNRRMAETSQIPIEQLLNRTIKQVMPPEIAPLYLGHHRRCVNTGESISFEEEFAINNEMKWWQLDVNPLLDQQGKVCHLVVTMNDISDRKCAEAQRRQAELSLLERNNYLQEQNKALMQLAKHPALNQGNLNLALPIITETIASTLNVERVSIWFYENNKTVIHCQDLYQYSTCEHQKGIKLKAADYPNYFQILTSSEVIVVNDALTDPRTAEFVSHYLRPFNIRSMLDSPIRSGGEGVGTLCLEQVREIRLWHPEDEYFVRSVADLIAFCFEARDRREAEAELQQKEEQYRGIFEAVNDAILINNLETGQLTEVNPAAHQMHGYSYTEFLQLPPEDLVHPQSLSIFAEYIEAIKAGKKYTCQAVDLHKEGYSIPIEVSGSPLNYNGVPHALAIVRDITERKQAELQLKQQTIALQETLMELQRTQAQMVQGEKMSALGKMVAGIAHEINNPVGFIHGNLNHVEEYTDNLMKFLRLYQEQYPNPTPEIQAEAEELDIEFIQEDLPKVLNSMKMGTERIRQIVLSLRNFSRLDEAEVKAVDLHEGIDSTLLILQHRLKETSERSAIQIIREYGELPLVECYPSQLNQVFMNILANAIDALEEIGTQRTFQESQQHPRQITIQTSTIDSDWIRIEIFDNGMGMPRSIRQQIFDPFFTTKEVGKGTGMGLPISYQIITEKHNGKLECLSELGRGTKFIIQIPINQNISDG